MSVLGKPIQPFVMFGPFRTPGLYARPVAPNSPRNWDIRQGYGYSGAVCVFAGTGLAEFDVQVYLTTDAHFVEWEIFAAGALAKPKPGLGVGAAKGIGHPLVNMAPWNINSIVVKDVTGFEQSDTGLWSCAIKCLEYKKPLPALARPIAAIPAVTAPAPTAADAAEIEMQKLSAQVKALGG